MSNHKSDLPTFGNNSIQGPSVELIHKVIKSDSEVNHISKSMVI